MFKPGVVRLVAAAIAAIGLHAFILMLLPSQHAMTMGNQQGTLQVELLAADSLSTDQAKVDNSKEDSSKAVVAKIDMSKTFASKMPPTQSSVSKPITTKPINRIRVEKSKQQPVHATMQHSTVKALAALSQRSQSSVIAIDRPDHVMVFASKAVQSVAEMKSEEMMQGNDRVGLEGSPSHSVYPSHLSHPLHSSSAVATNNKTAVAAVPKRVQTRILAEVHYPRQARRHGWQGRAEFEFDVHQQSIQTITLLASTGYPILDRAAQRGLSAVPHVSLSNGLYRMPVVFRLQ